MSQGYADRLVEIKQRVVADPNNSSTTNLAVGNGYTFTGTKTSTLGVAGIQVSLFADKNCTVLVEQSPDGTNWDIQDEYDYYANTKTFGYTVQAVNSYVRVIVSTASLTTTVFRLQTALCPVVEAVPRSLDEYGHLVTAVHHVTDLYGFDVENTPMGEMRTVIPARLVGAQFDGATIDPNFWLSTVANSATIAQANAQIVLTSGTNAAGSAQLNSVRRARYVGGSGNVFRAGVQLGDAGTADNTRRWGIAFGSTMPTITDGAWFQISGTTFSVVTLKGGAPSTVNSGSFNGTLGATYAPGTGYVTYEIYWTNSKVYFVIGDEILHSVNASAATWSDTMGHHVYLSNINSGNTTSVTLSCRVATIRRLGALVTQPNSKYQAGTVAALVLKYGPGNLHGIIISGVVNNAVATLYDNTAASGTIVFSTGAMGANTVPFALSFYGAPFFAGLTLAITGANCNVTTIYE